MPITVTCEGCGKKLRVKDELAGRKGKCPACGTVLVIPQPASADAGPVEGFPDDLELAGPVVVGE